MRIGDLNPFPVKPPDPNQPSEKAAGEAVRQEAGTRSDEVELSRLSQAISDAAPEAARLEQLRLKVRSGTYQVPPAELARRIVDLHIKGESES